MAGCVLICMRILIEDDKAFEKVELFDGVNNGGQCFYITIISLLLVCRASVVKENACF